MNIAIVFEENWKNIGCILDEYKINEGDESLPNIPSDDSMTLCAVNISH